MSNIKNKEQDTRIEKICNHVEIMNKEFGDFKIANTADHAKIKTDLEWLKRFFFIVATASSGGLIATLFNIIK